MGCRLIQTPEVVVVQTYASEIQLKHAVYSAEAQLVQLEYAVYSVEKLEQTFVPDHFEIGNNN